MRRALRSLRANDKSVGEAEHNNDNTSEHEWEPFYSYPSAVHNTNQPRKQHENRPSCFVRLRVRADKHLRLLSLIAVVVVFSANDPWTNRSSTMNNHVYTPNYIFDPR